MILQASSAEAHNFSSVEANTLKHTLFSVIHNVMLVVVVHLTVFH